MKALIPTGDDRLVEFAEVPEAEAGTGEVLIDVRAFSVNFGETLLLRSPWPAWRPGQDVTGIVARTVPGGPATGTRVVAMVDQDGWAERVAARPDQLVELPDQVGTEQAAGLPLAGLTALRLLRAAGPVIGDRLLLTGASGGVGHLLTQLAAAAGAEVTAVTSSPERGAHLLDLGAVATVRSVAEAMRSGRRFDLGLDPVGGGTLAEVIRSVDPEHGRVIWYGQAAGRPVELDLFDVLGSAPNLRFEPFSYYATTHRRDGDLATLVRLLAAGRLTVPVGRTDSWEATSGVLADLAGRHIVGKAVLMLP